MIKRVLVAHKKSVCVGVVIISVCCILYILLGKQNTLQQVEKHRQADKHTQVEEGKTAWRHPFHMPKPLTKYDRKLPEPAVLLLKEKLPEELLAYVEDPNYNMRYFMLENLDSLFFLLDTMDLCNAQWFDELDEYAKHIQMQDVIFQSSNSIPYQQGYALHHTLCQAVRKYLAKQDVYTAENLENAAKAYRTYYFSLVEGR